MLWPFLFLWQMLLPLFELADLFCYSILQLYYGWCYCHVADVITTVVVILICCWQMLLPCGRWKSHFFCEAGVIAQWQMERPLQSVSSPGLMLFPEGRWQGNFISVWVLRCYAEPHPICEADGICLCSYLGMDCLPLCIVLLWSICRGSGLPSPQY